MSEVTYEIVEHDGGWAYKVDGVFSEPFPSHATTLKAAKAAAAEQKVPGETEVIEFEDEKGKWLTMPFGQKVPFESAQVIEGVGNGAFDSSFLCSKRTYAYTSDKKCN